MMARATATRCCSPPDISPGRWFMRSPSPTSASEAAARSRASRRGRRAIAPAASRSRAPTSRPADCRTERRGPPLAGGSAPAPASLRANRSSPWNSTRPGRGPVERAEQMQQRGLADAGGAHQRDHLACADRDRGPRSTRTTSGPVRYSRSSSSPTSSAQTWERGLAAGSVVAGDAYAQRGRPPRRRWTDSTSSARHSAHRASPVGPSAGHSYLRTSTGRATGAAGGNDRGEEGQHERGADDHEEVGGVSFIGR